jgi:ABC-2 type transport system ATP-binding protein
MPEPIVRIEDVRKVFPYTNPDPHSNETDMWFDYLMGLLGRSSSRFAAQRKETVALDGIDLMIDTGQCFGLLGPNGAGKTTLIKVLSTILRPNAGTITVAGFDVVRQPAQARASMSVVAASGWLAFDQQLTLAKNLVFAARLMGLKPRLALERAHHALDVVGLADWRDETPNHLSSGMRQRLAIARGLLVRTPVFVLDEPTANVDPIVTWQIRDFVRNDLNRRLGQTIVLATHDMTEADQLCDRVAIVDHGKVLVCDRPSALKRALTDRVVSIDVPSGATHILARLRQSGAARQAIDTIDDDDRGQIRILLQPDVTHQTIADLLANTTAAITIVPEPPTLEDVFLHHAGRSLHVPADA